MRMKAMDMLITPQCLLTLLAKFEKTVKETEEFGFENARDQQKTLVTLSELFWKTKDSKSAAADGFKATSVIVSYTEDDAFQNGKIFAENGMQIAAGVPLECGEGSDFKTFEAWSLRSGQT